ncbi:MAG: hypothetical protein B5M51_00690 [Anaerolinea sp. 4484_236]|nr:MAG: hypothetical protein B5M51_00690 [Anaerolinea sp. 4484_236]
MTKPPARPTPVKMDAPPELEATYANLARIAHSPADIVLDFAHLLPGSKTAKVQARILMTPLSAKLLYKALGENLSRYEAAFGEISTPRNTSLAENLFKPFLPPDSEPKEE